MSEREHRDFSKILAYHMAPSMLGIKPASLITIDKQRFCVEDHIHYFNQKAATKGLCIRVLHENPKAILIIMYREALLLKQISDSKIHDYLKICGYQSCTTVEDYLAVLSQRIAQNNSFPHEIGLFLGYPLEDVRGFIENHGKNYIFCGYWKVYSDEKKARKLFQNYGKCRNYLCKKLDQGVDIYHALHIV